MIAPNETTPDAPGRKMSFEQLVRSRRSIRRYQARSVDRDLIRRLLEAANWAPSAHNQQPWRFCVVDDPEIKLTLSQRMGERWRHDLEADNADPAYIERRVAVSHARLTSAPVLVVASVSMAGMDDYPERRRSDAEWLMAVQSTALACQNLLLAAHHYGLGACWMCAPLFAPGLVCEVLTLPDQWHPQALITLGYPAEERERERQPVETRAVWR